MQNLLCQVSQNVKFHKATMSIRMHYHPLLTLHLFSYVDLNIFLNWQLVFFPPKVKVKPQKYVLFLFFKLSISVTGGGHIVFVLQFPPMNRCHPFSYEYQTLTVITTYSTRENSSYLMHSSHQPGTQESPVSAYCMQKLQVSFPTHSLGKYFFGNMVSHVALTIMELTENLRPLLPKC